MITSVSFNAGAGTASSFEWLLLAGLTVPSYSILMTTLLAHLLSAMTVVFLSDSRL